MKRFVLAAMISLSTVALVAQKPEMPKPGPEHQKLGAFIGNWTFEGEMKPGPMGPGGKMTGKDRIQWLPGQFFVERRFEGKGPMGEMKGLEVLGYDSGKKTYTFNFFDSMGVVGAGTMTVSGDTWTATGTGNMGGTTFHDRCTLAFGAGSSTMMIKCEMSSDGKIWAPSFDGKATKAKS